jgi:hypothetical protein
VKASPLMKIFLFAFVLLLNLVGSAVAATNPVPFINQPVSPGAIAPGAAGFTLTVNGSGFVSSSVVQWNGSPRATTVVSGTQLTANILASDVVAPTTATITVFSSGPGGGTSNPQFFQVVNHTSSVAYNSSGISTLSQPTKVVVADFNGDGKLDVATLNNDISVSVLLGNGDGTFRAATIYQPIGGLTALSAVAAGITVGDFNGDGKIDVAVSYSFFNNATTSLAFGIFVLHGNGDGTFGSAFGAGGSPTIGTTGTTFLTADLDGDGILDLVFDCLPQSGAGVCVALGQSDGTFAVTSGPPVTSGRNGSAALSDFNGDGKLDLVLSSIDSTGTETLAVALGNGDGTFGAVTTVDTISNVNVSSIVAADFDGNGIPDLAIYLQTCSPPAPCTGVVQTYSGNGDGTFQSSLPTSLGTSIGTGPLVVGDLNGDGILDLAVLNSVLLGRGDGSFALNPVPSPQIVGAVGDFNGDGKLDLIAPVSQGFYELLEIPGDFTGYSTPTSRTVVAGAAADYFVYIRPLYGYLQDTALSVTGLPAGVTASFSPTTITASNGSSDLSVVTSPATIPGTYTITLVGTSNGVTHTAPLTLVVDPAVGDFTGGATPTSQVIGQGMTASYAIQVESLNNFTGDVTLSLTGLPTGATANFSPNIVTGGSGSTTLTINTALSTPVGQFALNLTGTSGAISHSSHLILNVIAQADFTGYISPLAASVIRAGKANYTINIVSILGFTGNVSLSVSGLPTGATAKITPATIIGGAGSASLVVTTTSTTPTGAYTLTITGTCGTLVHSTTVLLNVNPSAGDFTGSVTPLSQSISAGAIANYTVSLSPLGGFTGDVTLSVSGVPAGVAASFSPGNIIPGASGSATLTISNTGGLASGSYPITLTGTSGGVVHSITITLVVN